MHTTTKLDQQLKLDIIRSHRPTVPEIICDLHSMEDIYLRTNTRSINIISILLVFASQA